MFVSKSTIVFKRTITSSTHSPAVSFLLHLNKLTGNEIKKSGPKHNLLKGDVLAFLNGSEKVSTAALKVPKLSRAQASKGPKVKLNLVLSSTLIFTLTCPPICSQKILHCHRALFHIVMYRTKYELRD